MQIRFSNPGHPAILPLSPAGPVAGAALESQTKATMPNSISPATGGALIAEGKTKIIRALEHGNVLIASKDDITAGDGAKHDLIPGKAALATRTTCNVFRLLKSCGIPVAFGEQVDATSFVAPGCRMLPYEVVVRREAHGSYLKRRPDLEKGRLFPKLLVEFFLKTNARKWKQHDLLCDDPLMEYSPSARTISLYQPSKPALGQEPFLVLPEQEVLGSEGEAALFAGISEIARKVFLILEKSWQMEGRTLADFKVEFGLTHDRELVLADVIDNDSWRVLENGTYIDKQAYRDGGALDEVAEKYARVAGVTDRFRLPAQQVIVWRGSDQEDVSALIAALERFCAGSPDRGSLELVMVSGPVRLEAACGLSDLHRLAQADAVLLAAHGGSDACAALEALTTIPVIPVLDPAGAALAAARILALRNPLLYMLLRAPLEARLPDRGSRD